MFKRYALVRQHDLTDCGAASLATVAQQYGLKVTLGRARDLVGTDIQGSNLFGLMKGAEALGFSAKGAKGDWNGLTQCPFPLIAHCINEKGMGHFVVVHEAKGEKAIVADPGEGIKKMTRDEFLIQWTGYVLILTPKNLKPETAGASKSGFLKALIGPHKGLLTGAVLCAVLFTVLGLGTSFFVRHLVDSILVHGSTSVLNFVAVGMILLLVFRSLFSMVRTYYLADLARKVDTVLISCYLRHIMNLPMKFFETRRVGEILSRVSDAMRIRDAVSSTLMTIIVDGLMILVAVIAMLLTNLNLGLACLAFVPVFVISVLVLRKPIEKQQRTTMERSADMQARLVEDISGAESIKVYGSQEARVEVTESKLVKMMNAIFATSKFSLSLDAATFIAGGAATLAVLWYGGHQVIDRQLSIGTLMFFYSLVGYMFDPLTRLSTVSVSLQDASIAFDRLWEILSLELEEKDPKHKAKAKPIAEGIVFENVQFRYGYREEVLKGIDIWIPAGRIVAIVGESGCGKSTLCKLTAKFYDPTEGRITVDGVDLRDLNISEWRKKIGYVSQDAHIFNGTIAENISLGKPDATLDEIALAARVAGLEEFINGLPERYLTLIGERGTNLSGGQRQRLAIARAVLCNPELFIFDEATSHLDTNTERTIQQTLREVMKGRTSLVIAHRLSTIKHADIIYVMKKGIICEAGSHEELLEKRGVYYALWRAQSDSMPLDTAVLHNGALNGNGRIKGEHHAHKNS